MSEVATTPEGATEVTQVTETTPVEVTEQQAASPASNTISYKYNHAEESLDLSKAEDRARAEEWLREGRYFVEKGKSKLSEYESDEGYKWFGETAKQFGLKPADLAKKWAGDLEGKIVSEYADEHGLTDEQAKKELKGNAEFQALKAEFEAIKAEREQDKAIQKEIDELGKAGINFSEITDEVMQLAKDENISLKAAYKLRQAELKDAEIADLKKKLGITETNKVNADSSMGAASGAKTEVEFTAEMIKEMTSEQRQANMPKILAWMQRKKT